MGSEGSFGDQAGSRQVRHCGGRLIGVGWAQLTEATAPLSSTVYQRDEHCRKRTMHIDIHLPDTMADRFGTDQERMTQFILRSAVREG